MAMAMPMPMAEPLTLRNRLKVLCTCGEDGWSYAIFWRFHPRNPLYLTVEDAYYEEQLGEVIVNMLPQVQYLGEGIVGEAAFTGKYRWVHLDGKTQEWNFTGQNIFEDDSGLHQQFSSGMKTIVVIPVKAWGVVQFGSKKKILERVEFLEQTLRLLLEIDDMGMLDVSGNAVSPLDCENYDLTGLLDSISSENSYDSNLKYAHGENSEDLLRKVYSSASPNDPFHSLYDIYQEGMTLFHGDCCVGDQLKATEEAQVVLSDRDSTDVLLKPNSSVNTLIAKNTNFGAWSGEVSCIDSLGQQLVSEIRSQEVADVRSAEENAFSCSELTVQDSALFSLFRTNIGAFQDKLQNSLDNQQSSQSSVVTDINFPASSSTLHGFSRNLEPVDMSEEFLKFSSMDDLCQWFAPSPQDSISRTVTALDNTLSGSTEFNPTSFGLVGNSSLSDIPVTCLAGTNSATAAASSDGKETSAVMHSSESCLLYSKELDFSCDQADEWWRNILTPAVSPATGTGFSECISELNTDKLTGTKKGLFSELGIEEPLSGEANYNSLDSSDFEYELSPNKRQVVEFSPLNTNPIQFANLAKPEAIADLVMQPISDLDKTNNLVSKKDKFPKLQVGKWVDDGHSINKGRAVPVHPQKPREPTKPTKKRARPRESTRPRPKDRQRIQDCINELRVIIPNGDKYSIDCLLDKTVKYMDFLQSITKLADKLKGLNEPKANEVVLRDSNVGESVNCGVTWACEVAGQTMVYPIITVDDKSLPGQMLVKILCEEQGFFLEIADKIRGLGLNILKAKMELRNNKLWAFFIVEAIRHVTRIDVTCSLFYLLQQTNTSGMDLANNIADVIDATIS